MSRDHPKNGFSGKILEVENMAITLIEMLGLINFGYITRYILGHVIKLCYDVTNRNYDVIIFISKHPYFMNV